jgi:ribosome biogenesis GTPase A
MRVRYSFSSRRTRKLDNIRKQKEKYPSLVKKIVDTSDIILQVLDARFLNDTRNKELEKEIKKAKKVLINVINKSDLVDYRKISRKESLKGFSPYVLISAKERKGIKELREKIKSEVNNLEKEEKRMLKKGKIKEKGEYEKGKATVGIIGVPNTGKSSIINMLIGKSSAGTGAEAGYTKGLQKIKLTRDILLIDSPGVIPNKKYSGIDVSKISEHAKIGARSYQQVKDPETVVAKLMKDLGDSFERYYKINAKGDSEVLLEKLGKKKGMMKKGGEVNFDSVSRLILKDLQEGNIKI